MQGEGAGSRSGEEGRCGEELAEADQVGRSYLWGEKRGVGVF